MGIRSIDAQAGNDATLSTSQAEAAYALIKRDIVRCELAPGQRMTEAELAEQYEIGRAAVRTALNRLYQEGLIRVLPRQGYLVAPLTLKYLRDLVGVRLLLEPPAARMAAGKVDIERLRALDAAYRAHFDVSSNDHLAALMRANADFHLTLAAASNNERLTELISALLTEMERLFHLGFKLQPEGGSSPGLHEYDHEELIEALAGGDGVRAEQLMIGQILTTQRLIVDALLTSPVFESVNLTVG